MKWKLLNINSFETVRRNFHKKWNTCKTRFHQRYTYYYLQSLWVNIIDNDSVYDRMRSLLSVRAHLQLHRITPFCEFSVTFIEKKVPFSLIWKFYVRFQVNIFFNVFTKNWSYYDFNNGLCKTKSNEHKRGRVYHTLVQKIM